MNKKRIVLIFLFAFLLLPLFVSAAGPFDYTPLEKIPGSDKETSSTTDFYDYVSAIYKFGIWAIGIVALFMLVFGGYTYITSAGNNSSMETAKKIITDALVGLIMALTAYLLLYVINPDLVKMKKLPPVAGIPAPGVTVTPIPGVPVTPVPGAFTCTDGKCSQVNDAIQNNASGFDPNILKSLLVAGEGCDKSTSPTGACGYSQLVSKNRAWCGISGTKEQTCAAVQNDIQLDINCAAKLLKEGQAASCTTTDIIKIASCYATGSIAACGNSGDTNYCHRVETYYQGCK